MPIVKCEHVWKTFHRDTGQKLLRHHLTGWFKKTPANEFQALKDISFEIERGEGLAIIGGNGAGKSTLLSVLSGLTRPTRGSITIEGRAAGLLELGSGFHPDLTGKENVFLNAALLGYTEKQTKALFGAILEFSGIEEFIDQPLRTYSSGMTLRLAFSVAIHMDPDILIVDEVFAVGDQDFQAKCHDRVQHFRRTGKTLVCVSHDTAVLKDLCDRAVLLQRGEMVLSGRLEEVLKEYERLEVAASVSR